MRRARHAAGRPWRARVLLARVGGAARAAGPRRREWRRAARRRVRLAVRALLPLDALGAAGGRRRAVGKVGAHGGVVGRGGRLPRGARRHATRIDQRHACARLPRRRAPRVAVARGGSERAGGPSAVRPRRSRCGRRAVGARRRHRREGRPRVRGARRRAVRLAGLARHSPLARRRRCRRQPHTAAVGAPGRTGHPSALPLRPFAHSIGAGALDFRRLHAQRAARRDLPLDERAARAAGPRPWGRRAAVGTRAPAATAALAARLPRQCALRLLHPLLRRGAAATARDQLPLRRAVFEAPHLSARGSDHQPSVHGVVCGRRRTPGGAARLPRRDDVPRRAVPRRDVGGRRGRTSFRAALRRAQHWVRWLGDGCDDAFRSVVAACRTRWLSDGSSVVAHHIVRRGLLPPHLRRVQQQVGCQSF
mmetsp:Transcript_29783/g.72535  ORF Transcript_29783/g.72535 Transcript_29783/m.72535 type:complete len:421 (+) Transcript_29783:371-1633(+)